MYVRRVTDPEGVDTLAVRPAVHRSFLIVHCMKYLVRKATNGRLLECLSVEDETKSAYIVLDMIVANGHLMAYDKKEFEAGGWIFEESLPTNNNQHA